MKTFRIKDGKVTIDGVVYSQKPTETKIVGKAGKGFIHSINIGDRGQFFPIDGVFNDGTTPIVEAPIDETAKPKGKLAKTELVEKSSKPVGLDGKPIKKAKTK